MSKKTAWQVLLYAVFLVVFNTIFFVVGGTDHESSVWLSYAMIHVAYFCVVAVPLFVRKGQNAVVLGLPLYTVTTVYFIVEFVVGMLFILLESDSIKGALVVQLLLAGAYAAAFITNLIANEDTADRAERQAVEVAYIKDVALRAHLLMNKTSDKAVSKELEKVYDYLHSSPSKSDPSVAVLELEVRNQLSLLEKAVADNDGDAIVQVSNKILLTMEERNGRLKSL